MFTPCMTPVTHRESLGISCDSNLGISCDSNLVLGDVTYDPQSMGNSHTHTHTDPHTLKLQPSVPH